MLKNLSRLLALVFLSSAAQQLSAQSINLWVGDSLDCQTGTVALDVWAWSNNPPFTYLWSDGSTTSRIINPLGGQVYSVTATDASGATATGSTTVTNFSFTPLVISYNVIQNACNPNGLGGIVDVTVTGGTPPYNYQWNNSGFRTEDVTGLMGDDYLTVGHSGNYCRAAESINVGGGLYIYNTLINESTCTMSNGSVQLIPQGNYSYEWSDGQTSSFATGLTAGTYGLTVTDPTNGCEVRRVFQVDNTPNCESTISGRVYHNANCMPMQNGYSCGQQVVITDNSTGQVHYRYTDINGYYSFRTVDATSYSISLTPYMGISVICPNSGQLTTTTTAQGGSYINNDFFIGRANDNDVQVNLYSWGIRPFIQGFNFVNFCNNGNLPQSGDITLTIDPLLTYVGNSGYYRWPTLTPVTPTQNGNVLTFPYTNLLSGECQNLDVYVIMNSNQPFGTTLTSSASITPVVGDAVPADNNDVIVYQVVNSYDPNDKQQFNFRLGNGLDAEIYTQDTEMDYMIRFQNTGNAPAIRVEIRDTFENTLVANSVKNINTSHRADVRIEGSVLIVTFDNIYLADSFSNEPASHGFISFKMDRQAGLPLQTEINNSAAIYFDFNEPVITNTQVTTIVQPVAIAQTRAEEIGLEIMPNPATTLLNVKYQLVSDAEVSLNIVNGMGQVIKNISQNQNQAAGAQVAQIAVEELPTGVYYLFITTSEGNYAKKFVKQ